MAASLAPSTITTFQPSLNLLALVNDTKAVDRLWKLAEEINGFLAADYVPNARFIEIKRDVNSLIEQTFRRNYTTPYLASANRFDKDPELDAMYYAHPQLHTLAGWLKKANKFKHTVHQSHFVNTATELMPLVNVVQVLAKKAIKKTDIPNPKAKANYVPPPAELLAIQTVTDVLTKLVESVIEGYKELLRERYTQSVDALVVRITKQFVDGSTPLRNADPFVRELLLKCVTKQTAMSLERRLPVEIVFEAKEARIAAAAKRAAHDARDRFLVKNVAKLAKIVELKKNDLFDMPQILEARVNPAGIQGSILFKFKDGSRFIVINKIVDNVTGETRYGRRTHYLQFPTTFHSVTLPNGLAMKTPSEKRMIEVFTK